MTRFILAAALLLIPASASAQYPYYYNQPIWVAPPQNYNYFWVNTPGFNYSFYRAAPTPFYPTYPVYPQQSGWNFNWRW